MRAGSLLRHEAYIDCHGTFVGYFGTRFFVVRLLSFEVGSCDEGSDKEKQGLGEIQNWRKKGFHNGIVIQIMET